MFFSVNLNEGLAGNEEKEPSPGGAVGNGHVNSMYGIFFFLFSFVVLSWIAFYARFA